jgi:ribosomal protein L20A (L18A)
MPWPLLCLTTSVTVVLYCCSTGFHNAYKEYRDTTLNGAVEQMYQEMGSRHRVRSPCIQIIKTATITAAQVRTLCLPASACTNSWNRLRCEGQLSKSKPAM